MNTDDYKIEMFMDIFHQLVELFKLNDMRDSEKNPDEILDINKRGIIAFTEICNKVSEFNKIKKTTQNIDEIKFIEMHMAYFQESLLKQLYYLINDENISPLQKIFFSNTYASLNN